MGNREQSSGKPGIMLSSRDQDATRRANKAKRSARRTAGRGITLQSNIMEDIRNDRLEQRSAAIADQRESQLLFRINQAVLASEDVAFKGLEWGTIAHKVANAILMLFPTVVVTASSPKRCQLAYLTALEELTPEERQHSKAIELGKSTAISALTRAYGKQG